MVPFSLLILSNIIWASARGLGTYPHQRGAKAVASPCICADSPEPSLLAYTKYGCR